MVGVSGWGDGDCVSEAELRDPGESVPADAAAAEWPLVQGEVKKDIH